MSKKFLYFWGLFICMSVVAASQTAGYEYPEYQSIQKNLAKGWNTWNTRSILSHVLLPEGFSINIAFKQHYWLDERYLKETLIGRAGEGVEEVRPGPRTYDGSYTQLETKWEQLNVRIETATEGADLVILVTPLGNFKSLVKMIVETGMLWNRPGMLSKNKNVLQADLPDKTICVYCTGEHVNDLYVQTLTPYMAIFLDKSTGISTGKPRAVEEIKHIIQSQKDNLQQEADKYGELSEAFKAIQAGIAWNLIYEPKYNRVVSTVGRLWNEEYGGYCLFGWDNFFLAYMTSLNSKALAYANVIEHLRGKTEEGFIPNDNRGNGSKSWDRSQPPVGSIMVKEIYKRYPEKWFLEAAFDDLLGWNRWWIKKRLNEGLLSYGSHQAKNPFNEPAVQTMRTAGYESGMDDSPMYEGIPFNTKKNTMELQDVGLNSLFIADCEALAEMAKILGRKKEEKELEERSEFLRTNMENLWDEKAGFYLNRRTDTGELSKRLSPTLFYPLLANVPTKNRAQRMIDEHFFNPDEFAGEWILPSIARNDPQFNKQRYWKGAIWPPLNFLTYLSLRQYKMQNAHKELAEKSLKIFLNEWKRKGYVSENYSSLTGTGDDSRLSSDKFHSWGALFGIISFIEKGILPPPELEIKENTKAGISYEAKDVTNGWWKNQASGTTASLRGISVVNRAVAWASGSRGTYVRTVDGGITWSPSRVPGASSLDFRDVQAVDANTAYLISAGCPAKILKTTDSGRTWTMQYSNNNPDVFFNAIAFWDAENGLAISDPIEGRFYIIFTADGGKTWNQIPPENIPTALPGEAGFAGSGTCLAVQGKKYAWFGTGGSAARVFRSTDRGRTWAVAKTPISSGSPSKGIFSVAFKDTKNGIIVGGDYKDPNTTKNNAARTCDGGATWTLIEEGSQPSGFRECVAYIPNTPSPTLIAVGPSGSDISVDGGITWTKINTIGYHSICFAGMDATGWAVGGNGRIAKFCGDVKLRLQSDFILDRDPFIIYLILFRLLAAATNQPL